MFKKMLKNTGILSGGVMVSRILGLTRDVLIARYFGTSAALEAYIVAFRLPNMMRSFFGEGFSDSVATPVLSEYSRDRMRHSQLGARLFSVFAVILLVLTFFCILLARPLVIVLAPGFLQDSEKLSLAISFTRITFSYLFFIGLVSVLSSLLYSLKKFAVAAFVPALFNVCLIAGIVFFRKYLHSYILAASVLAAGLIQFSAIYFYVRSQGIKLKAKLPVSFRDKDVHRMFRMFVFRIWSGVVYHLSVVVDTIYSSLSWIVGAGGLAAVYYSNRVIQFPLALIALSVSRVAMVDMSGLHKDKNESDFKKVLVFSFKNILFFTIPIVFFFVFMSREIIEVLFLRGSFGLSSLAMTRPVLFYYSFGLIFFCAIKLLVNTFYSLKDTRTPARTATIALAVNAGLSAVLMFPLKIGGIALASSIAAGLNFILLYRALHRKIGALPWGNTLSEMFKLSCAGLVLGLAAKQAWVFLSFGRYLKMGLIMVFCLSLFLLSCRILKIEHYRYLKRWIIKRK